MSVRQFTLENGMQVILEENHASKVISFNALVKVGSVNETDREAGICHVIEHMLFKGTPSRPTGTIARDVEAAGGEINAYTSIDQTVFYINMASRFADRGLEILSDAVMNPLFDEDELKREKEVILEEVRREKDNPSRMLSEYLFETSYKGHPYGRPIIGFPETIKSFTREELIAFHKRWYSPHNIVFIVVGDFETEKMFADIKKAFEFFTGPKIELQKMPEIPVPTSPHLIVKTMNIQSTYVAIGLPVPSVVHPHVPALDVLAHILGGTESSRLEQSVKEHLRIVHNIYAYSFTPKHPGVLVIGAMMADLDLTKAIGAIVSEIEKIKNHGVTAEELSRAKINIRSNEIYEKETVGGQAGKLAYFLATAGSLEFEPRYYQMLTEVHAKDVCDIAIKYLDLSKASVVIIAPEGSKWPRLKDQVERALISPRPTKKPARAEAKSKPIKIRLKNGATLIAIENHNLPLVSMCASFSGGTRFETKKTSGLSGLVARTMVKGTKTRSALDIANDIERLAGHIDGFSGRNIMGIKSEFISDYIKEGFKLFADVVTNPAFTPEEIGKEKRLALRAIKDQEDALSSLAFSEFLKTLYPKHPYGLNVIGSRESVKDLNRPKLVNFHNSLVRAGNFVLSVAGDINVEEMENMANEFFAAMPKGSAPALKLKPDAEWKNPHKSEITKKGKEQAHIVLGSQSTTIKSPDRFAMHVMNNILSGQGGRLFVTLRDKLSLAYAVNSTNQEGIEPGFFAVYIGTEPGKQKLAIEGILNELRQICEKPVTEEELDRAQQYLVGAYELDMQRLGAITSTYAFNETYGLDMKEIEEYPKKILAVTREDILKAARRYLKPDAYTLAVVRPV